jgi:hypothetical protein
MSFYTLHYRLLPFLKAAQLGFEYLAFRASDAAERQEHERLVNLAEEFGARSVGALSFDFMNSIDLAPIARLRATYLSISKQSTLAADLQLQKWIYDETLIPVFWSDYVSGKVEGLRFPAESSGNL